MFIKYLEPVFRPWRAIRNKQMKVRTVKGNFRSETSRVRRFGNHAGRYTRKARGAAQKLQKGTEDMSNSQPGHGSGGQNSPAATSAASAPKQLQLVPGPDRAQTGPQSARPGISNPLPPLKIKGFFWRRKSCTQCAQKLEMSWDKCPYCWQAYGGLRRTGKRNKTRGFQLKTRKRSNSAHMLGWVVPVNGKQRGDLFTLSNPTVIGSDPTCTLQLSDPGVSKKHIEITVKDGCWWLRDIGSSYGTLVNDKSVVQHELIDSDFIGLGSVVIKFKCL